MKISFTDFWPGFQNENNFFTDLLRSISSKIQIVPFSKETEILVYSCFGNQHHSTDRSKTKKIFYTGENMRPNFNECDFSWTFDFDDYDQKNIRIPLWLLQIDFFKNNNYKNPEYVVPLDYVTNLSTNPWHLKTKDKFCVVVNNHLPNRRDEIIRYLALKKEIHGFGRAFNNTCGDGEEKKLNTISDYRFNICFENKLYPGYYTEKLFHAKIAGCIPLYYSDTQVNEDFNPHGFLNLSNFTNIEEYVDFIFKVEESQALLNEIKNQPLFKTQNFPIEFLEQIKQKISKMLNLQ